LVQEHGGLLAPLLWCTYATWQQPVRGLPPSGHGTSYHSDASADHCCSCHRTSGTLVLTVGIWGTTGALDLGAANNFN
jgi:hypothetical protein